MTTTALVPIQGCDTQVLDMIAEINASVNTHQPNYMAMIKATLAGVSIEGAISILEGLGYENDEFRDMGGRWKMYDIGSERYFPDCVGRRADESHKIVFWGGPPDNLKWYFGTFFTMLEDRVLCEIQSRGIEEVAKYIGTDLTPRC